MGQAELLAYHPMSKRRPLRAPTRLTLILVMLAVLAASITEVAFRKAAKQVGEINAEALTLVQRSHAEALISLSIMVFVAGLVGSLVAWFVITDPVRRIVTALRSGDTGELKRLAGPSFQPEMAEVALAATKVVEDLESERDRSARAHHAAAISSAQRGRELELLVDLSSRIHGASSIPEIIVEVKKGLAKLFPGQNADVKETKSAPLGDGVLVASILAGERPCGFIHVSVNGPHSDSREAQQHLLDVVAGHASLAAGGVRTRRKLERQSLRDPLTGLYNRRYLAETLPREVARSMRLGQPVAVLAFDVDHFKAFNDAHGHPGGDLALKLVGKLLSDEIRAGDMACRQGGEEFAVVMPGADVAIATARAETLRSSIARTPVQLADGTVQ